MKYDAFISYSHDADGRLAPALQTGLQRLTRPWYRREVLHVFRDETGLAVNPHLWDAIVGAMDDSRYFVLLTSPDAAASPWVNREVTHWLATHPADTLLSVLTDGTLQWDDRLGDFDPGQSTALPPALSSVYTAEPRILDLRWSQDEAQLDLRHTRFRDAVADVAAPIHGIAKDELESEDVRAQRRARRLARGASSVLVLLLAVALVFGTYAVVQRNRARDATNAATAERLAALATARTGPRLDTALLLAVEGYRRHDSPQTRSALLSTLQANAGLVGFERRFGSGISSIGVSRGRSEIVIGYQDGGVSVFDAATAGVISRRARVARAAIIDVAFDEEGKTIAALTAGGDIHVLSSATLEPMLHTLRADGATAVWISKAGDIVLSDTLNDPGLAAWTLAGISRPLPNLFGVGVLALSPNGRFVAFNSGFDVAEVELATGRELSRAEFPHARESEVSLGTTTTYSDDGALIAAATIDGTIAIFQSAATAIEGRRDVWSAESAHSAAVTDLHFSNGHQLVSASADGTVLSWNGDTGQRRGAPFSLAGGGILGVGAVRAAASTTHLLLATRNGVTVWDPDRSPLGAVHIRPQGSVSEVAMSRNRVVVATQARIEGFGTKVGAEAFHRVVNPARAQANGADSYYRVAASSSGDAVAVSYELLDPSAVPADRHGILILDADLRVRHRIDTPSDFFLYPPPPIAVNRNAELVAWARANGTTTRILIARTTPGSAKPQPVQRIDIGRSNLSGLAFIARGGVAAAVDDKVRLWDARTGRERQTYPIRGRDVRGRDVIASIATDESGVLLAAGTSDGRIIVRNLEENRVTFTAAVDSTTPAYVAVARERGIVAAISQSGVVNLWDLESGQVLGQSTPADPAGFTGNGLVGAPSLVFGPGEEALVIASSSPARDLIAVWSVKSNNWENTACRLANRNLTRAEWQRFLPGLAYRQTCGEGARSG